MSSFYYQHDELYCEGLSLLEVANKVATPCFVYSKHDLEENCRVFRQAFDQVGITTHLRYAVKAASNLALLQIIFKAGYGADVVSQGEIMRALTAGLNAEKIVFSGVGKTVSEIEYALKMGVGLFNVESLHELETIAKIAEALNVIASVCLRINPNIDANTHKNITTGTKSNKFGLADSEFNQAVTLLKSNRNLKYCGLSCHIGSQIMQLAPITAAAQHMAKCYQHLAKQGLIGCFIDMGGGVGMPYQDSDQRCFSLKEYANELDRIIGPLGVDLIVEPGRIISASVAKLLTQVIYCKESNERYFVICDAGMTELARPGLYDAYHRIHVVKKKTCPGVEDYNRDVSKTVDIVGPVCESTDWLGKARNLGHVDAGDLLVIGDSGAYCASMASNYNTRPAVAEVLVDGSCYTIIRKPQAIESLWQNERML
ncbi:diaminopimelate decarboxylase [Piscirickettsia salmonis]|uniref:diaminopimelate decarboxylase n=1 Tax=Piscirickettsia salmonis TaxID=1238 RepID=UPI0007C96DB4|nr:Diaminopimelate decarboxylase [Piscirickettsiaceae bacterium NZ-RLO1]